MQISENKKRKYNYETLEFDYKGEVNSIDERIERFSSWKDHMPNFIKRGLHTSPDKNVVIVKKSFDVNMRKLLKRFIYTANLVTNNGDQYYAEQASNGNHSITVNFANSSGRMELGDGTQGTPNKTNTYSALVGPISASRKALNTGYPTTADTDPDNTGAGAKVLTWLTSWLTTDFNDSTISGGVVHDAGASPVSGSVLLTYWTVTAFAKTSTDTLKVFINHTLNGV